MRMDARIITMARVVARAMTAADMMGWVLRLVMRVVMKSDVGWATKTRVL